MTLESKPKSVERFTLYACVGGFRIRPEGEWEASPLLRALCDEDLDELRRLRLGGLPWVIGELMATAGLRGLLLEPKGRLRNPVLHLSQAPKLDPVPGVLHPFAELSGRYAAHWGIADLYPSHEAALRAALDSRQPFDTGEFGAKKEIEFARVRRLQPGGELVVAVRGESDDGLASADTAFWTAAGGNDFCASGEDALEKLGLEGDALVRELCRLAEAAGVGEINEACRERTWPSDATFEQVMEGIQALMAEAVEELKRRFDQMVELARRRLEIIRASRPR